MDNPKTPPPKLTLVPSTPGKEDASTPSVSSMETFGLSQFPRFRDLTAERGVRGIVIVPAGPVPPAKKPK
jgi:methylmalonyl-CoA mutase cobalamin-binding subunit